jgi:hypothetical protein
MAVRIDFRTGGVYGAPLVKFTLTYEGSLPSSGSKPKNGAKASIRASFHPQLKRLWETHPALQDLEEIRFFPKSGGMRIEGHHLHQTELSGEVLAGRTQTDDNIDLCKSIEKHGVWFKPLVRDTFALHCGLKILFLRQELPGRVYQGGDLDGRIKTLVDALTMPQHLEQVLDPGWQTTENEPMYCVMEDDSLISGLNVESEHLLAAGDTVPIDFVKLTIEVDVRVRRPKMYNQSFLG